MHLNADTPNFKALLASLSADDFAQLGLQSIVYVRRTKADQDLNDPDIGDYAVHAANGELIGHWPDFATARAAMIQHGMAVTPLH